MSTLGYYVTCDDAVCIDCVGHDEIAFVARWRERGGFEDWNEPIAILFSTEADTPTHCVDCDKLIPHRLTPDGHAYVREAIAEYVRDGIGDGDVVRAWYARYGEYDLSTDDQASLRRQP